jgi:hypothetical protein
MRQGIARDRQPMPENFCLVENYDEVARFIFDLRRRLTSSGNQLENLRIQGRLRRKRRERSQSEISGYVDFATMKRITPGAALVLASEYDRAKTVYKAPDWLRAINIERWSDEVVVTLDELGFLKLLGVDTAPATISVRDGKYIVPFISGAKVHGLSIDKLIRDMAQLADTSGVQDSEGLLQRSRVYDGLGEAIQNVEDHAYPVGAFQNERVLKKWWMTGSVEPSKKRFTVVIYDQGISIPVSLPRWHRFAEFRAEFARAVGSEYDPAAPQYDGEAIAQAVQLGRTSTGKAWHGKGLPLIRGIVENCADGTVRILSRYGAYSYGAGAKPTYRSTEIPLTGTLVEWDLFL